MKTKILLIALATLFSAQTFAEEITYKDVAANITEASVPANTTVSQEVYVSFSGLFPNSCYSFNGAQVTHINDFTHEVRAMAKLKSGICLRAFFLYNREVSLGKLKAGDHKVTFISNDDSSFDKIFTVK